MPIVTNPNLAYQSATDYTTWLDGDGRFVGPEYYQRIIPFLASSNVSAGDIVSFVPPTVTSPLSVAPSSTVAAESYRGIGVARAAAPAGRTCDVVVDGCAIINVGSQDPNFGDLATFQANTTAGVATWVAQGTWAATNFLKVVGMFLAADDVPPIGGQTTQAVIWVNPTI